MCCYLFQKYGTVNTKSTYLSAGFGGSLKRVKYFRHQCDMCFQTDVKFVDNYFDMHYSKMKHCIYVISDSPDCFIFKHIGHYACNC